MQLLRLIAFSFAALPACAQPDPEVTKTLEAMSSYVSRLEPILQQAKPREWIAKGAPDAYIAQWTSSLDQCKGITAAVQVSLQRPEHLTDVLPVLFRVQSLEIIIASLEDGIRRYQNPALAELMSGTRAESTPVREKLQQYVLNLAHEQDQQFQLVDREAQRCRQNLSGPPSKPRTSK